MACIIVQQTQTLPEWPTCLFPILCPSPHVTLQEFYHHHLCIIGLSLISVSEIMQPSGKKLTCHNTLSTNKETCETKLSCFAYKKSPDIFQYGCVQSTRHHLFTCNASPTESFVVKCCNEDMCNKNLTLTLRKTKLKAITSKCVFEEIHHCYVLGCRLNSWLGFFNHNYTQLTCENINKSLFCQNLWVFLDSLIFSHREC